MKIKILTIMSLLALVLTTGVVEGKERGRHHRKHRHHRRGRVSWSVGAGFSNYSPVPYRVYPCPPPPTVYVVPQDVYYSPGYYYPYDGAYYTPYAPRAHSSFSFSVGVGH